jgi:hypothetical protein
MREMNRKQKRKASEVAARNRTLNAIDRRYGNGETPKTSKELAGLLDRLYGTHFLKRYHG